MVDGFSTINSSITITKKGSTGSDFTAEIFGFNESPLKRKVTYTKVIGGALIPRYESAISKEVSFKFMTNNLDIPNLIDENLSTGSQTFDTFDLYKIALNFDDGSDKYFKYYYEAVITEWRDTVDNDILKGEISFILPLKNLNGDSTHLVGSDLTVGSNYDTTMGY